MNKLFSFFLYRPETKLNLVLPFTYRNKLATVRIPRVVNHKIVILNFNKTSLLV